MTTYPHDVRPILETHIHSYESLWNEIYHNLIVAVVMIAYPILSTEISIKPSLKSHLLLHPCTEVASPSLLAGRGKSCLTKFSLQQQVLLPYNNRLLDSALGATWAANRPSCQPPSS